MAAAFDRAGFEAVDLHMSDILDGRCTLGEFAGFAACGGFSYGDVLGAGGGWARSVLFSERGREQFAAFLRAFIRFALGVCNGCQMLAHLRELIPGGRLAELRAQSLGAVRVAPGDGGGIAFALVVPRGDGWLATAGGGDGQGCARALTRPKGVASECCRAPRLPALRGPLRRYRRTLPLHQRVRGGLTGFCTADGRVTIMTPQPRAGVPGPPALLVSTGVGRGGAVDEDVSQCPELRWGRDR